MNSGLKKDIAEIPIKDIEFKIKIKGAPGRSIVIELEDGVFIMHTEISTVKDVPFKKKGRKR